METTIIAWDNLALETGAGRVSPGARRGPGWLLGASDLADSMSGTERLQIRAAFPQAHRGVMDGTVGSPPRSPASASPGRWAPSPMLTNHLERGKQVTLATVEKGEEDDTASSKSPLDTSCFRSQEHCWGIWTGVEPLH